MHIFVDNHAFVWNWWCMEPYIELETYTNFSFLRGASHASELFEEAAKLGCPALGVTDRNSMAGMVRAHLAAKEHGVRLLVGARLDFADATPSLLCYPRNREGYAKLCTLLTIGKRRAPKGECELFFEDIVDVMQSGHHIWIALPPEHISEDGLLGFKEQLQKLKAVFTSTTINCAPQPLYLSLRFLFDADAAKHMHALEECAAALAVPLVATNNVHAHCKERRMLQDVLTCIREHCTIEEAGFRLHANAERHLKAPKEMQRLFQRYPQAIAATLDIAAACTFSFDEIRYEYPNASMPPGTLCAQSYLEAEVKKGLCERYPQGPSRKVIEQLAHEFALVKDLNYASYFLTVYDIVRFARSKGILCQGRGSAANSIICYCLGITSIDPVQMDLFFERFISKERNEPPDIDVDFEHERREEVIQYIYEHYGRDRAGLAATVISYRKRSALRDVGKALGIPLAKVEAWIEHLRGQSLGDVLKELFAKPDLDLSSKLPAREQLFLKLAGELRSFPRHLGQHVGGFVLTERPLHELVPIGNAAMDNRTCIEWDKDDLEALGMLKVDVLGLGMLSCIRRAFDLLREHKGIDLTLATLPTEDPQVYDMLCAADTIGVFQVESRAQMSMLPRLKPRCFYDLVIEVALVRPGPIQGDMVHPYLRRRNGEEKVDFPSKALERVLAKTLGVPLFQEQAMRIAVVAAGFTNDEADSLRRAMATFKRSGLIHKFETKFIDGMIKNGYKQDFAERCYQQILGFGDYGFPESHSASFALLVYASSWIKCHHPDVFACALLNSQPMGFYAPQQIIDDAKRHAVVVREPDVNHSAWECTLEDASDGGGDKRKQNQERKQKHLVLRMGLQEIHGLGQADGEWVVACRGRVPYKTPQELQRRSGVTKTALERLAKADAYGSMELHRQSAAWKVRALKERSLPLFEAVEGNERDVLLPHLSELDDVVRDYATLGFTLRRHPLALLRERFRARGYVTHVELKTCSNNTEVRIAGMVIVRQRPMTAKGVVFQTIEDETGLANLVIWPDVFERFQREVFSAPIVAIQGIVQNKDNVVHVVVKKLSDVSHLWHGLAVRSRDFH
jgi:error-prone DNA polymerase